MQRKKGSVSVSAMLDWLMNGSEDVEMNLSEPVSVSSSAVESELEQLEADLIHLTAESGHGNLQDKTSLDTNHNQVPDSHLAPSSLSSLSSSIKMPILPRFPPSISPPLTENPTEIQQSSRQSVGVSLLSLAAPSSSSSPLVALLSRVETAFASDQLSSHEIAALKSCLIRIRELNLSWQSLCDNILGEINNLIDSAPPPSLPCHSSLSIPRRALFTFPFFIDAHGDYPPPNIDTLRLNRLRGNSPSRTWSKHELKTLESSIKQQNQTRTIQQIVQHYKTRLHQLQQQYYAQPAQTESAEELDQIKRDCRSQLAVVKSLPSSHFLSDTSQIDWSRAAEMVSERLPVASPSLFSRTALECQQEWLNHSDPRINHAPFSAAEDKALLDAVHQFKGRDWIGIAASLGTNRTALQCLSRYQRSLSPSQIHTSKWSAAEDAALMAAVKEYGERNWRDIAACLIRRTESQCLHRYMKTLDPNIKSGKWAVKEDLRLRLAVVAYSRPTPAGAAGAGGVVWRSVCRHVPGRTDMKCRERYMNVIDAQINKQAWTPAEDEKLLALVAECGEGEWSAISRRMSDGQSVRTDNQCWKRWALLGKESVVEYRKRIKQEKEDLMHHFVSRGKERSQLSTRKRKSRTNQQQTTADKLEEEKKQPEKGQEKPVGNAETAAHEADVMMERKYAERDEAETKEKGKEVDFLSVPTGSPAVGPATATVIASFDSAHVPDRRGDPSDSVKEQQKGKRGRKRSKKG